jgi:shikimate kinase
MGWRDVVRVFPAMPPSSESRPTIVALTGFMAAGKSTVGRALASLVKWRFVDLDCEIERRAKRRVREIFATRGEAAFRALEGEALRDIVAGATEPTVIALGGGTSAQPQTAEYLRGAGVRMVFLELPLEQLLQRCRAVGEHCEQNPRPLAQDETAFCALYAQRLPLYREADLVVNAEGKTPEEIAREVAESLGLDAGASTGT